MQELLSVMSGQDNRMQTEPDPSRAGLPLGRTGADLDELRRRRRARDRMDREYAQPLDVPALARTALMSPAHFSRRFREAYSETPYSYLMTRRIERAKALLRRGDLSVTDVCFAVGCTTSVPFPPGSPSSWASHRPCTGPESTTSFVACPLARPWC